jgi:hypothetical protein
MAEVTASGATAAARATFDKTINVVVEVLVPVAAAVGGFFMPAVLGGGYSAAQMIYKAEGATSTGGANIANRAGWGIQALINAAVGGAFWHMRGAGGIVMKAIGGAVGGFFLGGALGCVPGIIAPTVPPHGLIDNLASGIQAVATEG